MNYTRWEVGFGLRPESHLEAARDQLRRMREGEKYLEQQPDGSFAPPTIVEVERRVAWLESVVEFDRGVTMNRRN